MGQRFRWQRFLSKLSTRAASCRICCCRSSYCPPDSADDGTGWDRGAEEGAMSATAVIEREEECAVAVVALAELEQGSHGVNVTVAVVIVLVMEPGAGAGSASGWLNGDIWLGDAGKGELSRCICCA